MGLKKSKTKSLFCPICFFMFSRKPGCVLYYLDCVEEIHALLLTWCLLRSVPLPAHHLCFGTAPGTPAPSGIWHLVSHWHKWQVSGCPHACPWHDTALWARYAIAPSSSEKELRNRQMALLWVLSRGVLWASPIRPSPIGDMKTSRDAASFICRRELRWSHLPRPMNLNRVCWRQPI